MERRNPSQEMWHRLNTTAQMVGATRKILVSQTNRPTEGADGLSCNLPALLHRLQSGELPE